MCLDSYESIVCLHCLLIRSIQVLAWHICIQEMKLILAHLLESIHLSVNCVLSISVSYLLVDKVYLWSLHLSEWIVGRIYLSRSCYLGPISCCISNPYRSICSPILWNTSYNPISHIKLVSTYYWFAQNAFKKGLSKVLHSMKVQSTLDLDKSNCGIHNFMVLVQIHYPQECYPSLRQYESVRLIVQS